MEICCIIEQEFFSEYCNVIAGIFSANITLLIEETFHRILRHADAQR